MEEPNKYNIGQLPPAYQKIPKELQRLIIKGKRYEVLNIISRYIDEGYGGLFLHDPAENEFIRNLWLIRIHLLLEWEMYNEALAWTCLECELNPWNNPAIAMKEDLKKRSPLFTRKMEKPKKRIMWDRIAGMRELKALLEEEVILPLLQPSYFKTEDIPPLNGILLFGPPGCGKSFIVEALARELGYNFFKYNPSDFGSIYVHGGQERILETFENLKKNTPCVVFFDEIDGILPSRRNNLNHHYSAEVNEFLIHFDRAAEKGILIIGATNFIDSLDEAAIRPGRFDKHYFVGPPDLEARNEAFKIKSDLYPHEKINYLSLAEDTEWYSFADIEVVVSSALRKAKQKDVKLSQGLIYEQILKTKPSLNSKEIGKYFNR
jgi:transitional endoplasmic reticulum ATPase